MDAVDRDGKKKNVSIPVVGFFRIQTGQGERAEATGAGAGDPQGRSAPCGPERTAPPSPD